MTKTYVSALIFAAALSMTPSQDADAAEDPHAMPYTVHVIDGDAGAAPARFMRFVDDMTAYMAALPAGPCAGTDKQGDLYFIYSPLIGRRLPDLLADVDGGTPRLTSPWVTLQSGPHGLRAVFLWNERQFLMDQALMAGARPTGIVSLPPISDTDFETYTEDYAASVLQVASPEAAMAAEDPVARRIPPDLLWLMRHASQSTRGPFSNEVQSAMTAVTARAADAYTRLNQAIVARCPALGEPEITYPTVFAVSGVFSTEAYRIDRLN